MVFGLVDHIGGAREDGDARDPRQNSEGSVQAVYGESGLGTSEARGVLVNVGHGVRGQEAEVGDGQDQEHKAPAEDGEAGELALWGGLAVVDAEQEAVGQLDESDEQQNVGNILEEAAYGEEVGSGTLDGD